MEPAAYATGLRPWELGKLTPAELFSMIEGQNQRIITEAWWRENMARQKRLRSLSKYIKPKKPQKDIERVRSDYEDLRLKLG